MVGNMSKDEGMGLHKVASYNCGVISTLLCCLILSYKSKKSMNR